MDWSAWEILLIIWEQRKAAVLIGVVLGIISMFYFYSYPVAALLLFLVVEFIFLVWIFFSTIL